MKLTALGEQAAKSIQAIAEAMVPEALPRVDKTTPTSSISGEQSAAPVTMNSASVPQGNSQPTGADKSPASDTSQRKSTSSLTRLDPAGNRYLYAGALADTRQTGKSSTLTRSDPAGGRYLYAEACADTKRADKSSTLTRLDPAGGRYLYAEAFADTRQANKSSSFSRSDPAGGRYLYAEAMKDRRSSPAFVSSRTLTSARESSSLISHDKKLLESPITVYRGSGVIEAENLKELLSRGDWNPALRSDPYLSFDIPRCRPQDWHIAGSKKLADYDVANQMSTLSHSMSILCDNHGHVSRAEQRDTVTEIAKEATEALGETFRQNQLSYVEKQGTFELGVSLSFAFGIDGCISIGICGDVHGNSALILSVGDFYGTPSASLSSYATITNQPDISYLEQREKVSEPHLQVGGSLSINGKAAGLDFLILPNAKDNELYYGVSASYSAINLSFNRVTLPDLELHTNITTIRAFMIPLFTSIIPEEEMIRFMY